MKDRQEILIVEDSATQAALLRHSLEQHGYDVRVAADGQSALASLRDRLPAAIVSDVVMPGMDGYDLCRAVKSDARLRDVPVILVTQLADPKNVLAGLECGADNFIVKPYDESYFLNRLQNVLTTQQLLRNDRLDVGIEMTFDGRRYFINSQRRQILDLLLSTYETAVRKNVALTETQETLRALNEQLEQRVDERTAALRQEVAERQRVEDEIRDLNHTLEERVAERTAQLREEMEALDAFAHSVSHDLKAPLRSLDFLTTVLERDHGAVLPEEGRRRLRQIHDQTRSMATLIQDLLATARVTRLPLQRRDLRMRELTDDVLRDLAPTWQGRNVAVELADLPTCQADEVLVRELLLNLITNALKFTQSREKATIEVGADASDGETVYFVRDNGIGLDMKYAERIFLPFERLHSASEYEGTGIGLSIVHSVVSRHGGRVWTEATPDRGATFYFTLAPREPADCLPAAAGH